MVVTEINYSFMGTLLFLLWPSSIVYWWRHRGEKRLRMSVPDNIFQIKLYCLIKSFFAVTETCTVTVQRIRASNFHWNHSCSKLVYLFSSFSDSVIISKRKNVHIFQFNKFSSWTSICQSMYSVWSSSTCLDYAFTEIGL